MKLEPTANQLDFRRPAKLTLEPDEQQVADLIADSLREGVGEPVGLFIWRVCQDSGVDHHRIARHLADRRKWR